jgi:hypothetical protein
MQRKSRVADNAKTVNDEGRGILDLSDEQVENTETVEQTADVEQTKVVDEPVKMLDPDKREARLAADKQLKEKLESRALAAGGNPDASLADPHMVRVEPRYRIVQNRSEAILLVPDLKMNDDDMGLMLRPGQVEVLTDFYTPQEINRSRGLRYAATEIPGCYEGENALVPIRTEEEGKEFKLPKKQALPKGVPIEDTAYNPFDERFEELELREAKREEKLKRKTLGMKVTKKHGKAPAHI